MSCIVFCLYKRRVLEWGTVAQKDSGRLGKGKTSEVLAIRKREEKTTERKEWARYQGISLWGERQLQRVGKSLKTASLLCKVFPKGDLGNLDKRRSTREEEERLGVGEDSRQQKEKIKTGRLLATSWDRPEMTNRMHSFWILLHWSFLFRKISFGLEKLVEPMARP